MKPFLYQVASLFYSEYGAEVSRLAFVFPESPYRAVLPEILVGSI